MIRRFFLAIATSSWLGVSGFVVVPGRQLRLPEFFSSVAEDDTAVDIAIDPKEAVLVFGRLAEKYIALDSSGGNCCYSGCTGCEFRLPGGGYKMADQTAARPKWIPHYVSRTSASREHVTQWSTALFPDDEETPKRIDRATFGDRIQALAYAPPLGGPYVAASAAKEADTQTVTDRLFEVIADGKEALSKQTISRRIKVLSEGEEGMTWAAFQRALS